MLTCHRDDTPGRLKLEQRSLVFQSTVRVEPRRSVHARGRHLQTLRLNLRDKLRLQDWHLAKPTPHLSPALLASSPFCQAAAVPRDRPPRVVIMGVLYGYFILSPPAAIICDFRARSNRQVSQMQQETLPSQR